MQLISHRFTVKVLLGMLLGAVLGLAIRWIPMDAVTRLFIANDIFNTGGQIFINLIKLLVIPIVLVSLVCGSQALGDLRAFGRVGGKTVLLYLLTTAIAIAIGLGLAALFQVGQGLDLPLPTGIMQQNTPSIKEVLINIFPSNIALALSHGYVLQVIVFAILFGAALAAVGEKGKIVSDFFASLNHVLIRLVHFILWLTPYGVFCLLAALFIKVGFGLIAELALYFGIVLLALLVQLFVTYGAMLRLLGNLRFWSFLRKMKTAMLFAFSVSSSNASIPVVLRTVESRLGVRNRVASFVIPLGSTINMDGTAIMQGVATVFIAHAYHVSIGVMGYLTVIAMATLASIGTAGVPSVGLLTLAMVLQQVGLPVQGVAMIIGVDRLLDMSRTAVNIAGDSVIACLVGKSEGAFDQSQYDAELDDDI